MDERLCVRARFEFSICFQLTFLNLKVLFVHRFGHQFFVTKLQTGDSFLLSRLTVHRNRCEVRFSTTKCLFRSYSSQLDGLHTHTFIAMIFVRSER